MFKIQCYLVEYLILPSLYKRNDVGFVCNVGALNFTLGNGNLLPQGIFPPLIIVYAIIISLLNLDNNSLLEPKDHLINEHTRSRQPMDISINILKESDFVVKYIRAHYFERLLPQTRAGTALVFPPLPPDRQRCPEPKAAW